MTNPTDDDSYPSDLFEYRGVVCQLVYRYPWYTTGTEEAQNQRQWGVMIYWPNGEVLTLARIHDEPEQAIAVAHFRINEEPRGTHCPTTDATTD
jgi:hypothetical protein